MLLANNYIRVMFVLLQSFSHLVSPEYEAAGGKGEEKGAKRGAETNRG